MVTGVKRSMVVTLSKKAERTAAMRHSTMIMVHTLPRDTWYAWHAQIHKKEQARIRCYFFMSYSKDGNPNKHCMLG